MGKAKVKSVPSISDQSGSSITDTGSYSGSETLSEMSSYSNLQPKLKSKQKKPSPLVPIVGLIIIVVVTVGYFLYQRSNRSKKAVKKQAQDALIQTVEQAASDIDEATIVGLVKQYTVSRDEIINLIQTLQIPPQTPLPLPVQSAPKSVGDIIDSERYIPDPFSNDDSETVEEEEEPVQTPPPQIEEIITVETKPPSKNRRPKKIASVVLQPSQTKEITLMDVSEPTQEPAISKID